MPIGAEKKPSPVVLAHGAQDKPQHTYDQIVAMLNRYERTPFTEALALWLQALPSKERMIEWGHAHPDKLVMTLQRLAGLHGYAETSEIIVRHRVEDMSDMELLKYHAALQQAIPLQAHSEAVPPQAQPVEDTSSHASGEHVAPQHQDAPQHEANPPQPPAAEGLPSAPPATPRKL